MVKLNRLVAGIVLAASLIATATPTTSMAMEQEVTKQEVTEQESTEQEVTEKDNTEKDSKEQKSKDQVITGTYGDKNVNYKYSDSFFANDPKVYDTHMATMSMNMTYASCTYIKGNDYSDGAKTVKDILGTIGFGDGSDKEVFVNDGYTNKPTTDSIGCAIASKEINVGNDTKRAISITIRSANYENEWASNVTLGTNGEAKGFSDSADKVVKSLDEYLSKYPEVKEDVDNGNTAFWIQGFSRGGAVANLTAKRLIDRYQEKNDKVFAYCIEAPQGGVESAEISGKDYSSIHNIINKDDLVPYVAPTEMGFKRYGVDHYLNDESSNPDNLRTNSIFKNNKADNDIDLTVSQDRLDKVKEEVKKLVGNGNTKDYMPFTVTGKKLNISLKNITSPVSISDTDGVSTSGCIQNFLDLVSKKIGRDGYVNKGVQDASVRLMQYLNSGSELRNLINDIDKKDLAIKVGAYTFVNTSGSDKTWGMLKDMFSDWISGREKEDGYKIELTEATRNNLIEGLRIHLKNDSKLRERLSGYEGGSDKALDDIALIAKEVVNSIDDVDSLLTFGMNVGGMINNHTMLQTLAWLRTSDSWY